MDDIFSDLTNVPLEGQPAFPSNEEQTETETPSESSADENQDGETPSPTAQEKSDDENKLPYHKQPRWIERERQWKEKFSSQEASISQLREELESRFQEVQQQVPRAPEQPDERFVKLYGDNPEAYRLWKEQQEELLSQAEERVFNRMNQQSTAETRALQEGANYVENSLQELEAEGKDFKRNELMKFMLDFKEQYGAMPSDADDNIDFHKGYDLFMTMKGNESSGKAKSKARKNLADFSGSSGSGQGEETPKDYLTSQDLRNLDWDTLTGR